MDLVAKGKKEEADKKKKKKSEKESKPNTEKTAKNDTEETLTEEPTEEEKKESQGSLLTKILEDYKNSQKNKGTMNSRSFGSIE